MADNSSYQEDRTVLVGFVRETHSLLGSLVATKKDPKGKVIFPRQLHKDISAAWKQFDSRFSLPAAEKKIFAAKDERIAAAGLYGAELALKLSIIDRLRRLFRLKGGVRILSRLFNAIDNVLESLIAATGLDEALKEIKDSLNSCLE